MVRALDRILSVVGSSPTFIVCLEFLANSKSKLIVRAIIFMAIGFYAGIVQRREQSTSNARIKVRFLLPVP